MTYLTLNATRLAHGLIWKLHEIHSLKSLKNLDSQQKNEEVEITNRLFQSSKEEWKPSTVLEDWIKKIEDPLFQKEILRIDRKCEQKLLEVGIKDQACLYRTEIEIPISFSSESLMQLKDNMAQNDCYFLLLLTAITDASQISSTTQFVQTKIYFLSNQSPSISSISLFKNKSSLQLLN